MLARFVFVLIFAALAAVAYAGGVPVPVQPAETNPVNTKISWQPAHCTEPSPPGGLPNDPETSADAMNASVVAYDRYAKAAEAYMHCLAAEGTDGKGISDEAQAMIDAEQKKVIAAGETFHARLPAQ